MKKLLSVSIVAMLAVSPMMARAELTPVNPQNDHGPTANANGPLASGDAPFAAETIYTTDATGVASAAYVKGAYNASIRAINKVNSTVANISTNLDSTIKGKINSAAGAGLTTSADGVLAVNVDSSTLIVDDDTVKIANKGVGATQLSDAVNSSLAKADSALQSGNIGAGLAWDTANGGKVKVDTNTYTVKSADNTYFTNTDGAISLSTTVTEAIANANSALQSEVLSGAANLASAAGDGLEWDATNHTYDIKKDSTLALDTNGNLGIAANSITTSHLSTALNSTLNDKATKAGVLATINSSTASVTGSVPVFAAWGDTSAGTITVSASGNVTAPAQYQDQ